MKPNPMFSKVTYSKYPLFGLCIVCFLSVFILDVQHPDNVSNKEVELTEEGPLLEPEYVMNSIELLSSD